MGIEIDNVCCLVYDLISDSTKKSGHALIGDVDYEEMMGVAGWVTPVPGGVGPMTVAMLMKNTLDCAKRYATKVNHAFGR